MIHAELRYHVPRSQVWEGSRGGQTGHLHVHVLEDLDAGRLSRRTGQPLCGRHGWYERAPLPGDELLCPTCVARAARYGVEVPVIAGKDW